jgi:hypothetical protein
MVTSGAVSITRGGKIVCAAGLGHHSGTIIGADAISRIPDRRLALAFSSTIPDTCTPHGIGVLVIWHMRGVSMLTTWQPRSSLAS